MSEVTIIDSLMGSGKTEYAISYINTMRQHGKFIFITPFLSEVDRIKSRCYNFNEPVIYKGSKLNSLKLLLQEKKNIVSTHALFTNIDEEVYKLILMGKYTLILDEVMDVISPLNISKCDVDMLFKQKLISLNGNIAVKWIAPDYEGKFNRVKLLAEQGRLLYTDTSLMMWQFPIEIFKIFTQVYILTYYFSSQIQRYYYDLYGLKYIYKSVVKIDDKYLLTTDRSAVKKRIKEVAPKIRIVEGNINKYGKGYNTLSFNLYK